jgi:hypothetical protein
VLRRGPEVGLKPADRRRHRRLHLRYGKLAVVCIVIGAAGGLATMVFELDRGLISTAHGMSGVITAATFLAAARFGRELEGGQAQQRGPHAWTMFLAVLGAAATAVAGLVLLP